VGKKVKKGVVKNGSVTQPNKFENKCFLEKLFLHKIFSISEILSELSDFEIRLKIDIEKECFCPELLKEKAYFHGRIQGLNSTFFFLNRCSK
jgi:hypothetical protein